MAQDAISFAKRPETIGLADVTKPQTGAEYLASLDDDREVYIYGERVKLVTKHPAFRNTARMIARLYDALYDPKIRDKIITPTDTGNGGFTHAFFKAPKTMEDLLQGRSAIAEWARLTYGWAGRSRSTGGWMMAWLMNGTRSWLNLYQRFALAWYGS